MKTLSSAMSQHIEGEVTSLVSCWHINRTDGVQLYFTDHDQDLLIDETVYLASAGYDRGALKGTSGASTDEMELQGNLNSDCLDDGDLASGLFDYAEVHFFMVNWQDLSAGIIPLRKGWFGEVTWADGKFTAELRGLSNALQREIGGVYTPECQVDLGDAHCGLDLVPMAATDTIATVATSRTYTLDICADADGMLDGGLIHFTSGANLGRKLEIKSWRFSDKRIELFLDPPYAAQVGDEVVLYPGCDKRFDTCRNRFNNLTNFRGFPHIPGTDALAESSNG